MTLPSPPRDWIERVEREQRLARALHAGRRSMSEAEYDAAATRRLGELCGPAELRVRVRVRHLGAILADGRLRNQFETGHSGGYFDPHARAELEWKMLGVPLACPSAERPLYGYLEGSDEDWALPGYGTVMLRLADAVRARSTFTVGDTLDQTLHAKLPAFAPRPLLEPTLLAANPRRDLLDARSFADAADRLHRYAEAQIYGGVTLDDVRAVCFRRPVSAAPATTAELDRLKIPWEVQ